MRTRDGKRLKGLKASNPGPAEFFNETIVIIDGKCMLFKDWCVERPSCSRNMSNKQRGVVNKSKRLLFDQRTRKERSKAQGRDIQCRDNEEILHPQPAFGVYTIASYVGACHIQGVVAELRLRREIRNAGKFQ